MKTLEWGRKPHISKLTQSVFGLFLILFPCNESGLVGVSGKEPTNNDGYDFEIHFRMNCRCEANDHTLTFR